MAPRLQLHNLLESICPNVYFQPPTNVKLNYPCIIYHRDYAETKFADSISYNYTKRYLITVIDRDPDSNIPDQVAALPMTLFNRFFTSDDLNHDVYRTYF
jgi:hypothetical protein